MNDKFFTLTQSCSTKKWNEKGISLISDLMVNNRIGTWDEISRKSDIPNSQSKTYTLLNKSLCKEKGRNFMDSNMVLVLVTPLLSRFMRCLKMTINCWGLDYPFSK